MISMFLCWVGLFYVLEYDLLQRKDAGHLRRTFIYSTASHRTFWSCLLGDLHDDQRHDMRVDMKCLREQGHSWWRETVSVGRCWKYTQSVMNPHVQKSFCTTASCKPNLHGWRKDFNCMKCLSTSSNSYRLLEPWRFLQLCLMWAVKAGPGVSCEGMTVHMFSCWQRLLPLRPTSLENK